MAPIAIQARRGECRRRWRARPTDAGVGRQRRTKPTITETTIVIASISSPSELAAAGNQPAFECLAARREQHQDQAARGAEASVGQRPHPIGREAEEDSDGERREDDSPSARR